MREPDVSGNGHGPQPPAPKQAWRPHIPAILFSMKFAIWIAVILAVTSILGVLVQEFFPVRDAQQAENLRRVLPGPFYELFMLLQLADPFRALWFKTLLGLLALSLGLCAMKNFGPNFRQAFTVRPIGEPQVLTQLPDSATLHHTTPDLFEQVVRHLRRRLYVGKFSQTASEKIAALHHGGLSRTGPVILHVGILVLVLGGLATSIVGRRDFQFGSPGETVPLEGSRYVLRVDDFQIETNEMGQVKQYRSQLTVLDGEREVHSQEISVNHPLRFAGYNVYQASYQMNPTHAASLALFVRPREEGDTDPHGHSHAEHEGSHDGQLVQTTMEATQAVPGHSGYAFRVRRFFSHLMMTDDGPRNASKEMVNPAVEIEILRDGDSIGTQWAFMRFSAHARQDLPFVIEMRDVRPSMATGLDINTNPGAPLVWAGFLLSTLGLVFGFLIRHRTVYVIARPADRGWTLWMGGHSERERIAFSSEFQKLVSHVHTTARRLKRLEKERLRAENPPQSPTHTSGGADNASPGDVVGAAPGER